MDVLGPQVFDLLVLVAGYVGRPLQRVRARRLARKGRIRSVLFGRSNPGVMDTRVLDGAAEVWEGRIRLAGRDLWIEGVEGSPEQGPGERRGDGDLIFTPKTAIYALRTHQGTVKWAVLEWQANQALTMLGFPPEPPGADVAAPSRPARVSGWSAMRVRANRDTPSKRF